jgi:hypothetical protein
MSEREVGLGGGTPGVDRASPPLGRRRFLQGVGAAAGLGALATVLPSAPAAALAAGASQFVALPIAVRVVDTRDPASYEFTALGDNYVRVPLAGRHAIPAQATAIVATLTAVNHGGGNWATIQPAGADLGALLAQNKLVSALNMFDFMEATANLVQVKLANGALDLYSAGSADLVLDVIGYYQPVTGAVRDGRFVGLNPAQRAVDTRETIGFVGAGQSLIVDLTGFVPDSAASVMINLTATECTGPGYFTVYPFSSPSVPAASSLNVNYRNATRAAAVVVPVATQSDGHRYIKVFALAAAKLIVDVNGYFTGPTAGLAQTGLFVPVDPVRILDTRDPGRSRLWPGWTVEGSIPGSGAVDGATAVVNLTGVNSMGPGFLTVSAARNPQPPTSNLNFSGGGQFVPNHAVTPITSTYGYQVFASGGAHVIVDYAGYYTGTPASPTSSAPVNPPPPPIAPWWTLQIPAIGVTSTVKGGNSFAITDSGHTWHWTNSGFIGEDGKHVAVFAHRTTHGGVFRNLHLLGNGDLLTVTTGDGREYTYQVVRRDLTNSNAKNILNATTFVPGSTFSMIACSRTDFTPTNVNFRIVVTAAYVGWRDITIQ